MGLEFFIIPGTPYTSVGFLVFPWDSLYDMAVALPFPSNIVLVVVMVLPVLILVALLLSYGTEMDGQYG